jgi:hypothetical protein
MSSLFYDFKSTAFGGGYIMGFAWFIFILKFAVAKPHIGRKTAA